ncbi:hypothetical protein KKF92_03630 [Patescibacteria group bacterium]|nr:hypothetical protein [Patescibacteria group bacterium]
MKTEFGKSDSEWLSEGLSTAGLSDEKTLPKLSLFEQLELDFQRNDSQIRKLQALTDSNPWERASLDNPDRFLHALELMAVPVVADWLRSLTHSDDSHKRRAREDNIRVFILHFFEEAETYASLCVNPQDRRMPHHKGTPRYFFSSETSLFKSREQYQAIVTAALENLGHAPDRLGFVEVPPNENDQKIGFGETYACQFIFDQPET